MRTQTQCPLKGSQFCKYPKNSGVSPLHPTGELPLDPTGAPKAGFRRHRLVRSPQVSADGCAMILPVNYTSSLIQTAITESSVKRERIKVIGSRDGYRYSLGVGDE